jgi:DNA mismatch repair protein MutL
VKFSDEKLIYASVFFAGQNALLNEAAPIELERRINPHLQQTEPPATDTNSSPPLSGIDFAQTAFINNDDVFNYNKTDIVEDSAHNNPGFRYLSESAFIKRNAPETPVYVNSSFAKTDFSDQAAKSSSLEDEIFTEETAENIFADNSPAVRLIGEAFLTYIIIEHESDLYIIDKHAAHERILFEELRRGGRKLSCQYIIGEKPVAVSDTDAATAVEFAEDLFELGFEYTVGAGIISFTGIPSVLSDTSGSDLESFFSEILQNLTRHKNDPLPELIDETLHSIACKAAIKGNRFTGEKELLALAERVLFDNAIRYCPHGRPVIFKISQRELEKNFKRIV